MKDRIKSLEKKVEKLGKNAQSVASSAAKENETDKAMVHALDEQLAKVEKERDDFKKKVCYFPYRHMQFTWLVWFSPCFAVVPLSMFGEIHAQPVLIIILFTL